ncbi:MAG: NADPH-dependent F420 reductase [Longimicrobiales bacterium]
MNIAIIGSGNVGSVLGRRWSANGHAVVFGSRRPDHPDVQALAEDAGARTALPTEAVATAEVVVLATPWEVSEDVVRGLGDLGGRIVVDCTNPLAEGLSGLTLGTDTSGGERIQAAAAGGRVVKAFNTTGTGNMDDPVYESGALTMFLCGDDAEARQVVSGLAWELGFEPVDCGPITSARYLEPMAMAWITLAHVMGHGPDFGFALLRRNA